MPEVLVPVTDGAMFVRTNQIDVTKPTILMPHEIEDSGVAFHESFDHDQLSEFNLVAPDFLGYGKSSVAALN